MLFERILIVTTAGLLAFAVIGSAAAENGNEGGGHDDVAGATAPVTLGKAVATAEGVTGGRAISAGYGFQDGALIVEVDLVKDQSMLEVLIDSGTGAVVAQGNDTGSDREDDGEDEDG